MSPQSTLVFFCALLLMLVNSDAQASKGIFNVNIQLTQNPTLTTQDISAIGSGVCAVQIWVRWQAAWWDKRDGTTEKSLPTITPKTDYLSSQICHTKIG